MKEGALNQVGNIPFTPSVLLCLFSKTKQISDKARYLEQDGRIIRLKRSVCAECGRWRHAGAIPYRQPSIWSVVCQLPECVATLWTDP